MTAKKSLDYSDLYHLSEEMQKLVGGQLQSIYGLSEFRYALDFRMPGESQRLIIDLTPSRPFIVSTSLTRSKGIPKKTPVLNFLRAHFENLRLTSFEIAQKPNRTLKLEFGIPGATTPQALLKFKCFPHGQQLFLMADEKQVSLPWRAKEEEEPSFVEPERREHWDYNEKIALDFLGTPGGDSGGAGGAAPKSSPGGAQTYRAKLIRKLEKAIAGIDQGMKTSKEEDELKIQSLQQEAESIKLEGSVKSGSLDKVYDEIKRLKRKTLLTATRRNELTQQLEEVLKNTSEEEDVKPMALPKKVKEAGGFSGSRIHLEAPFELWVGRTAWQNDDLVKLASPHELWIHLRDYPGAHGVIRSPKKSEPGQGIIDFCCQVVAVLSQSKKRPFAEGDRLDFIVTPKKYVKKPKGAEAGRVIVEREQVRRVAFKNVKFEVN